MLYPQCGRWQLRDRFRGGFQEGKKGSEEVAIVRRKRRQLIYFRRENQLDLMNKVRKSRNQGWLPRFWF